ncbi:MULTISPECIES: hypothetical protein [Gammaproteobacteria]|uniref:hypothetical protein n=1 Tax=Gammaproteobacteria TaxID=1236 RepID=UPI000DCF94D2|nr:MULTISPECIES: hypothetical protein [Gammaproteobacteria]RTE85832.1 hypothetical protein DQX04_10310 [Aliidiomarina sp. B3213]TCZ90167.1 hypothetical protein EYQ95_10145 [Lysobacter sp. N42]
MKKVILTSVAAAALLSTSAFADTIKVTEQEISLDGIEHVEIKNGVGEINIRRTSGSIESGSVMLLEVEFDGENGGFFGRDKDVSDMEVEVERNGSTLTIRFEEDDIEADFDIELPDPERLSIDLGVGAIDADTGYSHVDVNLGVGDILINSMLEAVSTVAIDVGVGEADVSGGTNTSSTRAMVSEEVTSEGNGQYRIRIDVGVGDAKVRL